MSKRAAVAAVVTGLLLVAGCTGDAQNEGEASAEASAEQSAPAEIEGPTLEFGEPHEFEDGVAVSVSKPKPFKPSSTATTGGEPDYVSFEVHLENGTDRKISTGQVAVTVESGDGQAGDIIDVKKGLAGPPSKQVVAGKALTWKLGFGVIDPADVTVQVQVGTEREPVTIRG